MHGAPIAYGVGGVVTEVDVLAAFAQLQLWANDSDEMPGDFTEGRRLALGLKVVPDPI